MNNKPSFSIIIPLYNEAGNIVPLLDAFREYFSQYDFELILVNDGSKDETHNILLEIQKQTFFQKFLKIVSYSQNK